MKKVNNLLTVSSFVTENGTHFSSIPLSYQTFGCLLGTAPVVLVNHALTGNAEVCGENGWWNDLIGPQKTIDTNRYTVLAFDVPGNGSTSFLVDTYQDFVARDVAKIFLKGLELLQITQLHTLIGGSVGGGIAWEMLAIQPHLAQQFIPIATDWKSTDWLIANCFIQETILNNSENPLHDARMHAMLCYRTPESFQQKFDRTQNEDLGIFNIESWLLHHGKRLQKRFQLSAYKLMNQLLKTIDITRNTSDFVAIAQTISADIHIVAIDSDLFFTPHENRKTYELLLPVKKNVFFNEIQSIHGHDAFLIEYEQLNQLLKNLF